MRLKLELQDKANLVNLVKQLKQKCLQVDYNSKRNILTGKIDDNEKLIYYLTNCDSLPASAMDIKTSVAKLNEYTAKLFLATDNLDNQYQYKASQVSSQNCELQYDNSGLELDCPQLAGVDCVETQRLLFNSLSSLPPGLPSRSTSSGSSRSARLPPPRPGSCLPGLEAPVPGYSRPGPLLPSMADHITGACLKDIKDQAQHSRNFIVKEEEFPSLSRSS